jgi:hypothetical protein
MSVTYPAATPDAPTLVLAHGAGAGQKHPWMTRVAKGLAARGVHVVTFDFPYIEAHRHVPDRAPVLELTFQEVWRSAASEARGPLFAGGKSMGGRIASQVAARHGFDPPPAGLIFFGYPLHPPGRPSVRRDHHLPSINVPMLFFHGARDGFGSPEEMRALVAGLSDARLELVEDGDHSLVRPKRSDPAGQSIDQVLDAAAAWITR